MGDIVLTDAAGRPKRSFVGNAQLGTKIYFWHNPRTDHIMQGAGPQFDAFMPYGYERITCYHAHEAEKWSARLTEQDKRIAEMNDYERECIEGPMRDDLRKQVRKRLAALEANPGESKNANLNVAFLKRSLRMLDEQEAKAKTVRESFLHVEAFEHGH